MNRSIILFSRFLPGTKQIRGILPRHRRLDTHQHNGYSSSSVSLNIAGNYPPITTPFNEDESIAWDRLEQNITKWNTIPLRGYVVQGSTGECVLMNHDERVELVKRVSQMTPSDKIIIAGSGCESTRETILLTNKMATAGAHAVLVVTPFYYKGRMTNDALTEHYNKVADESNIPVILYSVPANTGIDLHPDVIVSLSNHPNIIGMKDSGGDIAKIGSVVHRTLQNGFQVLAGSASFLLSAYVVGCVGGVCGLSNVLGKEVCQLESLYKQGKMADARELQHRLIAPNMAVTKMFGVAGVKKSMDWLGYYGGPTRSPLLPLSSENEKALRTIFQENGFL